MPVVYATNKFYTLLLLLLLLLSSLLLQLLARFVNCEQSDDLYQLIPFNDSWWSCLDLIMETPIYQ